MSRRILLLDEHKQAIGRMLNEKSRLHGEKGGFFETNTPNNYTHAIGEVKIKLNEFSKETDQVKKLRHLVKAMAWVYLIYESEIENYASLQKP